VLKCRTRCLQPRGHDGSAVIVETHAVDHGTVLNQAEQARLFVAGLGLAGDGSHLDVAEAELSQGFNAVAFLVEARGKTEGRRKGDAKRRCLERRCRRCQFRQEFPRTGAVRKPDAPKPDCVGALGVHP
jgi:hypothetical protein